MKKHIVPNKIPNKLNKKLNMDNSAIFLNEGIDIDNRTIHLIGEIVDERVYKIIAGIQLMIVRDNERPIDIYINSPGGCVYTSLGLYNFLESQNVNIRTINIGRAMSGASIVFLGGHERYMYKDAVFMLHTVSSSTSDGKLFVDMVPDVEETKKLYIQMCKIYEAQTNINYKDWYRKLKFQDQYYRAKEALEMKIIHGIIKQEGALDE